MRFPLVLSVLLLSSVVVAPPPPPPTAKVQCPLDGSESMYMEQLSSDYRLITASTCPNSPSIFGFEYIVPYRKDRTISIPRHPVLVHDLPPLDPRGNALPSSDKETGIAFDGVSFHTCALDGGVPLCRSPGEQAERFTSPNFCGSIVTKDGIFQYHGPPSCIETHLLDLQPEADTVQIGWMLDGFPIYSRMSSYGLPYRPCSAEGDAGKGHCLDPCGGIEGPSDLDDLNYRYFISGEPIEYSRAIRDSIQKDYFPSTPQCLRGCCPDGLTCDPSVRPCTNFPSSLKSVAGDTGPIFDWFGQGTPQGVPPPLDLEMIDDLPIDKSEFCIAYPDQFFEEPAVNRSDTIYACSQDLMDPKSDENPLAGSLNEYVLSLEIIAGFVGGIGLISIVYVFILTPKRVKKLFYRTSIKQIWSGSKIN